MLKKLKQQFRILPMVIFLAVLTLSIRVNNLFDQLKNPYASQFSIAPSNFRIKRHSGTKRCHSAQHHLFAIRDYDFARTGSTP